MSSCSQQTPHLGKVPEPTQLHTAPVAKKQRLLQIKMWFKEQLQERPQECFYKFIFRFLELNLRFNI